MRSTSNKKPNATESDAKTTAPSRGSSSPIVAPTPTYPSNNQMQVGRYLTLFSSPGIVYFQGQKVKNKVKEISPEEQIEAALFDVLGIPGKSFYSIFYQSDESRLAGYIVHIKKYIDAAIRDELPEEKSTTIKKVKFSTQERIDLDLYAEGEEERRNETRTVTNIENEAESKERKKLSPHEESRLKSLIRHLFINSEVGLSYTQRKVREAMASISHSTEEDNKINLITSRIQKTLSVKGKLLDSAQKCTAIIDNKFNEKVAEILKSRWKMLKGITSYRYVEGESYINDPVLGAEENAAEVRKFYQEEGNAPSIVNNQPSTNRKSILKKK